MEGQSQNTNRDNQATAQTLWGPQSTTFNVCMAQSNLMKHTDVKEHAPLIYYIS